MVESNFFDAQLFKDLQGPDDTIYARRKTWKFMGISGIADDPANDRLVITAASSGFDFKQSVRLATDAALPTNTRNVNVLTASANGAIGNIDGVAIGINERVLVKNESTGANNGIYNVTSLGSGSTPWVLTRSSDFDEATDVTAGALVAVEDGSANGDKLFALTTNDPITVNTTALTFAAVVGSGGGSLTAPTNPGEDQRVAVASSGNLTYPAGLKWNGTQLRVGTGTMPTTTSAGIALSTGTAIWGRSTSADHRMMTMSTSGDLNIGGADADPGPETIAIVCKSTGSIGIGPDDGGSLVVNNQGATLDQPAITGGTPNAFKITAGAHLDLSNNEFNDVYFDLNRTVNFAASGTITYQRNFWVQAPVYTCDAATKTLTYAALLSLSGPAVMSTNMAATHNYGIWIEEVVTNSAGIGFELAAAQGTCLIAVAAGADGNARPIIMGRNGADSADVKLLRFHGATLEFGEDSTNLTNVTFNTRTNVNFLINGANAAVWSNKYEWYLANHKWRAAVTSPVLDQDDASSGAGQTMTIRAQRGASGSAGGFLHLEGGQSNGSTPGGIRLIADGTTSEVLLEASEIAANRRVVALCYGALLTTTHAPSGVGDRVVIVADADTIPTANAGSGHVYYSDGGRPGWRFNDANLRFDDVGATSASAGANGAVPAQVVGYIVMTINGTARKVPYFAT